MEDRGYWDKMRMVWFDCDEIGAKEIGWYNREGDSRWGLEVGGTEQSKSASGRALGSRRLSVCAVDCAPLDPVDSNCHRCQLLDRFCSCCCAVVD